MTHLRPIVFISLTIWCLSHSLIGIADCSFTSAGLTPLVDLGSEGYQGFSGGLYPAGQSVRPLALEQAAASIVANDIRPRNAAGEIDTVNGKIVMISIGMSNATQEFSVFTSRTMADPARNPQLVVVDGAQGAQTAQAWADNEAPWSVLAGRLTSAGVTAQQVQVVWLKDANPGPGQNGGSFPTHAQILQDDLEIIVRQITTRYPNAKLTFLSGRTRSYSANPTDLNPEPFAYESSFPMRWMIEKQLSGDMTLNYDPARGARVAPLLLWSAYIWIDGINPRSDGYTWLCSDLTGDFTHPSSAGVDKVANQLRNFFKTDRVSAPWFLKQSVAGQPPSANASATVISGSAPLTVNFGVTASDPDGTIAEYRWNFDDGTSSTQQNPQKIYRLPGVYHPRVGVFDNSGNHTIQTIAITVGAAGDNTAPAPPSQLRLVP